MISMRDIAWSAGFLEGEGSFFFSRNIRVSAEQVQKEPLTKLKELYGGYLYQRKKGTIYIWVLISGRAAGLMMTLFHFMSPRRRIQIKAALREWRSRPPHARNRAKCKYGHEFYKQTSGRRGCRTCEHRRSKEFY